MSETFKKSLKELANAGFDNENDYYYGNIQKQNKIQNEIGMVIREEIKKRVDTFFDKPSPDILIEKVLSGEMTFDELYGEKYSNRLYENEDTKLKNYLKIVSKLLSKETKPNENGISYVLLAKWLILKGGIESDDKTIKDKMFSLSRKL